MKKKSDGHWESFLDFGFIEIDIINYRDIFRGKLH